MALSLKLPARFAPRQPRCAVEIDTAMLLPDDNLVPLCIRNISPDGFMATTDTCVDVGKWIGVELPGGGIVPVQVRWATGEAIGVQFRRPLDIEQMQHFAAASTGQRSLFLSRLLRSWF